MSDDGLIAKTAVEVVGLLRAGEVSIRELLDALERQIAAVDGAGRRAADSLFRPG